MDRPAHHERGAVAGWLRPGLPFALVACVVLLWMVRQPGPSPILATVPLHLDPAAEVDVAMDSRQGRLFILNAGTIQVFDTRTGTRLYAARTGMAYLQGMGGPAPVVDAPADRAFVPNLMDNTVGVLDARGGRALRILRVGHRPDAIAVDERADRLIVASTADWTLTTLDARTGVILHSRSLGVGDAPGQLTLDQDDGRAFVASYGGQVTTLDVRTGRVLRSVVPDRSHVVTDLVVDARAGRVLGLVEARADLVVLDARSGEVVRLVTAGQSPDAIAVDPRTGRAFVSDSGAHAIQVLATRRGGYVHTVAVGAAPLVAIDTQRQRVFVASASGLSVLDGRSGALLRTHPLALDATALVVDERSGHLLAISVGGTRRVLSPWAWLPRPLRRWLSDLFPMGPRLHTVPSLLRVLDERRL